VVEQSFIDEEAGLILRDGERVGWIHVRTTTNSVELWQLFIAEDHRGQGLGAHVLRCLQARASTLGLPILLSVLRNNPAKRLYGRAGFILRAESPHHLFLWWTPAVAVT
jgi:ribosomal protein S18 acetylase RimI-like enzyme